MKGPIVVFCVPGEGHFQRLLPIVQGLVEDGRTAHVLTHARFRSGVERLGAHFVDLFGRYPVEAADATSIPIPSRFVTYAGVYGDLLTADVAELAPALIVYDMFSVVAPLIGQRLGVPHVNVCAGHAAEPARVVAELRRDPRVATSAECWAAVRRLRDVHGMKDANPLSYAEIVSPFLNLYSEPREFIDDAARAAFEPIAFFGSLAPSLREGPAAPVFSPSRRGLRVYVSFGTVIWRYFEAAALAALSVIAHTLGDLDADVVIGLGRRPLDGTALAALRRPNVRVVDYADQWTALQEADVFVTHHGLNSTHEGIFHEVPMLSYPFFGDQPAQARRCQELGLAVPLVDTPRAPLVPDALRSALTRVAEERAALGARLAEARSWELRTMADRGAIVRRMLSLSSR